MRENRLPVAGSVRGLNLASSTPQPPFCLEALPAGLFQTGLQLEEWFALGSPPANEPPVDRASGTGLYFLLSRRTKRFSSNTK